MDPFSRSYSDSSNSGEKIPDGFSSNMYSNPESNGDQPGNVLRNPPEFKPRPAESSLQRSRELKVEKIPFDTFRKDAFVSALYFSGNPATQSLIQQSDIDYTISKWKRLQITQQNDILERGGVELTRVEMAVSQEQDPRPDSEVLHIGPGQLRYGYYHSLLRE